MLSVNYNSAFCAELLNISKLFMFQKLVYVPKDACKIQMSDTCENGKP